jgi:hypothetical protein
MINFVGNLTYRIFVRRLYNEQRYASPYTVEAPGSAPDNRHYRSSFTREAACLV